MTFYEGDEQTGIFQNWFECMEHERKDEFVEYARTVATRFLNHVSRVKKRGLVFRRSVLEIKTNDGWHDIFDPELDQ